MHVSTYQVSTLHCLYSIIAVSSVYYVDELALHFVLAQSIINNDTVPAGLWYGSLVGIPL